MRNYTLYLKDIVAAVESIEAFVEGMDLKAFQADDKTASAVIRKFEIIGEVARQIPEGMRQGYPEVPWKEMAGMRDRLIHFYIRCELPAGMEDHPGGSATVEAPDSKNSASEAVEMARPFLCYSGLKDR